MKKPFKAAVPKKPDQSVLVVKSNTELLIFLINALPTKSRQNIKSLLTHKQIEVNGNLVSQYNYMLHSGDKVKIKEERASAAKPLNGFSIIFEDEFLIVIDKHAGILSMASEKEKKHTAYNFLSQHVKRKGPDNKIFIVHRLDRETSGLMIFAKNTNVQKHLQDNWKEVITERTYVAVTEGTFEKKSGVIESYLHENKNFKVYSDQNPEDGKHAITNYKVIKSNKDYTMLEVRLDTGRKNQIRVHMQELGHSIISDKKYGSRVNPIDRMGLHSQVLGFIHPVTQKKLRFITPIPRKFERLF